MQETDRSNYQKQLYETGIRTVQNHDTLEAIRTFKICQNIHPENKIGISAKQKADSLKSILRKDKIKTLIGNWKWKPQDGNWSIPENDLRGKMITINNEEIQFFELYKSSKEWKLVNVEKLIFSENPESFSYTDIIYSNNEVWEYNIDTSTGELTAFYIGEKTENNYTMLVCGNPRLIYFKLL